MKTSLRFLSIVIALTAIVSPVQGQERSLDSNSVQTNVSEPADSKLLTSHFVPGEITVKLRKGAGDFKKQTGMVSFGIQSLDGKIAHYKVSKLEKRFRFNPAKWREGLPDLSRIYKISFPESLSLSEIAEAFASDPNVEYAEAIPVNYAADVPDDALYSQMQHLTQIHAPEAWAIHKGENGTKEIVIAINDSGVDWDHEDLQSNVWQNLAEDADGDGHTMEFNGSQWILDPGDLNGIDDDGNGFTDDLIGWNFIGNNGDPNPYPGEIYSHGTGCAGISNAVTNNGLGIASISWNLKLMPVCAGQGDGMYHSWDGLIYAAENGADIISNSWGGGPDKYSIANQEVINYVAGLGSIVIAAAGNDYNSLLWYPASYKNVISVTSLTADDKKSYYSNYNLAVDISVPIDGPEGGILTTLPGDTYGIRSGTSSATPLVAGCLGLLKSYHPDWSNDQLIKQVLGTTDNIDSLNPNYINMLGSGRVNAYRMLSEENVLPLLKLELNSFTTKDENGNGINEPGENVNLNFDFHNYGQGYKSKSVIVSISTEDPDITIINGSSTLDIPADSSFSIHDQLVIQVRATAKPHFAELMLNFETDSLVIMGQDIKFKVLVAPSGIFVFEGFKNSQDYSGTFITRFLDHLGYNYLYSDSMPSLNGFETVFLSFGNFGESKETGIPITVSNSLAIKAFLESGGNLYVESGGIFYKMSTSGYMNITLMKKLFGVYSYITSNTDIPIDTLSGVENTPTAGMLFAGSDQRINLHIDKITPNPGAMTPLIKKDYGNVAVMNDSSSTYGQKTFYMGYSLAGLRDRDATSSRNNVLVKTMEFFGYSLPQGYILSNFIMDKTEGSLPLEVQFNGISITDPSYPITSWQWDFDNNGTIDSDKQNPVWTYDKMGVFDVKLITSNGLKSDTLVMQDLITITNAAYLVYEGVADGDDYSGTFIKDFLQKKGYSFTYQNNFPINFKGFSAIFLSFGNSGSGGTLFDDQMASTLTDYLVGGGFVYLEGADALGNNQAANTRLLNLFGLANASNGSANTINSLEGKPTALTHEMVFTGNNQVSNASIDKYAPSANGITAFYENGYSSVAVQQSIPDSRRTFCFSYSLADLTDGIAPNTREELLHRIMDFFDIYTAVPEIEKQQQAIKIYPNPFSSSTTFEYEFEQDATVNLSLFNQLGQQVKILVNEHQSKGGQKLEWNASGIPPGVYYCRLKADNQVITKKIIKY